MTYVKNCTLPDELMEQVAALGLDGLPKLLRIVINEAMTAIAMESSDEWSATNYNWIVQHLFCIFGCVHRGAGTAITGCLTAP
jgi:hypothetical protein